MLQGKTVSEMLDHVLIMFVVYLKKLCSSPTQHNKAKIQKWNTHNHGSIHKVQEWLQSQHNKIVSALMQHFCKIHFASVQKYIGPCMLNSYCKGRKKECDDLYPNYFLWLVQPSSALLSLLLRAAVVQLKICSAPGWAHSHPLQPETCS